MARGKKLPPSPEEKVAQRMGKELADFTLDLEAIGRYLAISLPFVIFSRVMEVLESAQYNKEEKQYDTQWREYPDNDRH